MNRRIVLACAVSVLLARGAFAGELDVQHFLPADAIVSLCYYGDNPDIQKTAFYQLCQEPEVKESLASVRRAIIDVTGPARDFLQAHLAKLEPLLGCHVGIALLPGEGPGPPQVLVVARFVGVPDAARKSAEAFLAELAALAQDRVAKAQVAGMAVTRIGEGPGALTYGFQDGYLLLATSPRALERALARNVAKVARSAGFGASLGSGTRVALLLYNHAVVMERFGARANPGTRAILDSLGLYHVRSVALRLGAKGRALVGTLFVHTTGERRGLLRALAPAPVDRSLLRLAPRDAGVAWAMNVDAPELYNAVVGVVHAIGVVVDHADVRGAIAAFEQRAGMSLSRDVFGTLGLGTVITTASKSLLPSLIVSQAVKDGDRLEHSLAKLVAQLDTAVKAEVAPDGGAALRTIRFGKHTIRYLATPRLPVPLAPCYARVGDRVIFALTPIHLKDYLAFLDNREPSVLESPGYRELAGLVPKNAASVSYSDFGESFVELYGIVGPLLTQLQAIPFAPAGIDLANLPSKRTVRKHMFGAISYTYVTKDRIVHECHSPMGFGLLGPLPTGGPMLAIGGIGAGMLLPALSRARAEARFVRDRVNLNRIAIGCAIYLNEHGDNRFYPKSLGELYDKKVLVDKSILVSPLDRNPPKLPNGLPCSYESCFDRHPKRQFRDDFPPNVMMAWDRRPFVRGRRSVLFFDSHVEVVDEAGFQALLKQLDELVQRLTKPRKEGGHL